MVGGFRAQAQRFSSAYSSTSKKDRRKAADEGAQKFDCRKDRVAVLGSRDRAIDLAMPRYF